MWTPHFRKHRPGVVSLLAVSTALAMIAANTFLALTHNVRTDSHGASPQIIAKYRSLLSSACGSPPPAGACCGLLCCACCVPD